jgi:hypothetical protein
MPWWDPRGTHCASRGKCVKGRGGSKKKPRRTKRATSNNDGHSVVEERGGEINDQAILAIWA